MIAYDSDFGIHLTNEEETIGDVADDRSLYAIPTDVRDITPVWSPDGTKIAFGLSQHDHWEIYLMDADGSNQRPMFETALDSLEFEYGFVAERMVSWAE